jgi:hypothetical protein
MAEEVPCSPGCGCDSVDLSFETRGLCRTLPGPCEFTSCRLRLEGGKCALDTADLGGVSYSRVGRLLGLTRQRILQIETVAIRKFGECKCHAGSQCVLCAMLRDRSDDEA